MTTVKINVGGTPYEVSRSLLEQHKNTMISRMASETWQKHPNETLFIERDGQRFRYILDYMRDGKISLPGGGQQQGGITKSSLLDELAYYGFEGVNPGSIEVEFAGFDATKYLARLTEDFEKDREDLIRRRNDLNVKISSNTVAHACCIRRMATGGAGVEFNTSDPDKSQNGTTLRPRNADNHLDYEVMNAVKETSLSCYSGALNEALSKYGLRMSNYHETSGSFVSNVDRYGNGTRDSGIYKVTVDIYSAFSPEEENQS